MTNFNKNIRYTNSLQALKIAYISYEETNLLLSSWPKKEISSSANNFSSIFFFVDKKKIKKIDSLPPLPDGIILYPIDVVG